MRTTVTVVTTGNARRADVTIEAPATTPLDAILSRLRDLVSAPPDATATIGVTASGLRRDGDGNGAGSAAMSLFGGGAMRDGVIVTFGASPGPTDTRSYLELRVVAGPFAGDIHRLAMGTSWVGRGDLATIGINDPGISRRHALLTVDPDGVRVADAGSTNGTTIDGVPVGTCPIPLRQGMRLRMGSSALTVAIPDVVPMSVRPTADGHLSFNRPPRLDAPDPTASRARIGVPAEPTVRVRNRLPLVTTIAPLVAGIALAAIMRRPEYVLFTVLSPLMMAGQWLSDLGRHRKATRADRAGYEAALGKASRAIADALSADAIARRHRAPDAVTLSKTASAPSARLWERRRDDPDFLVLNLGCGTALADVDVVIDGLGTAVPPPSVNDVPITVGLTKVGVLGIAGPRGTRTAMARAIVGQLAVLHSPRDLTLVLLTEAAHVEEWGWLRCLPHLQPLADTRCQVLLGIDADSVAARVEELATLIEARRQAVSGAKPRAVVVLVDSARAVRRTAALADVLAGGPDVGVYAVCLDEMTAHLPEECGAVAVATSTARTDAALAESERADPGQVDGVSTTLLVAMPGAPRAHDAIPDGASIAWADRLARALAPLRDDSPGRAGTLPPVVRWLDIAGFGADMAADLVTRWRAGAGSTSALVGTASDAGFVVDIARDGPHALIAGTTGSGKSEFLQTLVASLACANRPDELTFVLVDYKGGAAFGACAALPHTVGVVTDLDGRLVERALASLRAELKRREAALAAASAPNLEVFRAGGGMLARLIIVVDEFASLAEELPDFVGGLVGIAQRGRSLGVHLVLATQRPEGVVNADIRANTNLRICLGVVRESESRDVIDATDAARMSRATPGRGYARTGHGELQAFQTGRVGGLPADQADTARIDVQLSPLQSLCVPRLTPSAKHATSPAASTDLDSIVAACRSAAHRLGLTAPKSPWLPPLPALIPTETAGVPHPLTAVLAVLDLPAAQARQNYEIDLARIGHLVIAGSARSGRTTALRTIIGGLAASTSVRDLHVYAIDCAGGSLAALATFPHCGATIGAHEHERVRRLLSVLKAELVSRQSMFATEGFGSLTEQRARSSRPLPHLVVLVDGWESLLSTFEEVDSGAVVDASMRLLREGASVGIHIVVTADRAGLVGRLASTVENRLVLRLADRSDFSLIGLPARAVPADVPAGRGFFTDTLTEAQVCTISRDPAGPAQLAALAAIGATAWLRNEDVPPQLWPRRVDPLPSVITTAEISTAVGATSPRAGSALVTLGLGGDELAAVTIDLLEFGPGFLIAGPPRSGRSTALATVAAGLRAAGWRLVAVTPRDSVVRDYAHEIFDATQFGVDAAFDRGLGRLAVLVDDAEIVAESPVAGVLDRLMRTARDSGHLVVIAGTTEELSIGFRGFVVDVRRARTGLLLAPRGPLDGEVLGVRLPRVTGEAVPVGRGQLIVRGVATQLQVALPTPIDRPDRQPQTVTESVPIAAPPCDTLTLTTPSDAAVKKPFAPASGAMN
jgi:S-DNA-T family DNA segregation ATPase FtsK/SpoIIIE